MILPPTQLEAHPVDHPAGAAVVLTWTHHGRAHAFEIERHDGPGWCSIGRAHGPSFSDIGIQREREVRYRVRARRRRRRSRWSAVTATEVTDGEQ